MMLIIMVVMVLLRGVVGFTDPGDMAVLQAFKKSARGSAPEVLQDWVGEDACAPPWPHIVCSRAGRVSQIDVASKGLSGRLPLNLNSLSGLVHLGLQHNSFTGPVPSLCGLKFLVSAYLDNNLFDSVPHGFLQALPSLQVLSFDHNPVAPWILSLHITASTQLHNLSLTNVSLSGPFPDFLAAMPSLQVLHLAYNSLTGRLPLSLAGSNLRVLQLNNQQKPPYLNGPIDVVGSMRSLSQLWLHVNWFSGIIPTGLADAVSLTDLKLNDNQLVGPIPWGFKNLPLTVFTAQNNLLIGPIPPIATPLGGVYDVRNNHFCQAEPGLQCSLFVAALLEFLGAVRYPLPLVQSWQGNDPCVSWVGIVCRGAVVSIINLPNSRLSGTISPFLSNITTLRVITLNGNALTGPIPDSLLALRYLKVLDVRNNRLSGHVPVFPKWVSILISGNSFDKNVGTPSSPSPIPSVLPSPEGSPSPPLVEPPLASYIPPPSVSPAASESVTPSSSSVISIPATPAASNSMARANDNQLSFPAATIIGPVAGAFVLILIIPLAIFLFLRKRRQRFQHMQSPNPIVIHPREDSSDPELAKIMADSQNAGIASNRLSAASSAGAAGAAELHSIEAGNLVISVQVLRNVTGNFSERNVLGRGGFGVVYKGELDDGRNIAVKRMEAAVISSKALSEFQAEIAVLTRVRHRHLVALLGYCIDGNERLLVYEYMPLGPLSQHLFDYPKNGSKPLDWKKRLTIALDVARGMEYLHSLAHTSFVHRDLKPSNILLADDYHAKVSDFGLVKLAPDGKCSIETKLAGTFGYLAPEYAATGRVTTKSDVFSFGVVLMELITGRRALEESEPEESMHLVSWFRQVNLNEKGAFCNVVDPALQITLTDQRDSVHASILTVAELAGHCTAREPSQRPTMGHAVSTLAPLVEKWKPNTEPSLLYEDFDLGITLPQALKKWQAYEEKKHSYNVASDYTFESFTATRPTGFAQSLTSADGR